MHPLHAALLSALLPLALLPASALAQGTPISLEQAMAEPDWIGPAVEQPAWTWDSRNVQYRLRRDGSLVRDSFIQPIAGGAAVQVADDARHTLESERPVYDAQRAHMAFVRNGDVFLRHLGSGALTQVTRTEAAETQVGFGLGHPNGPTVTWRSGDDWFRWSAAGGTAQVLALKAARDPAAAPKPDLLREQQLRTLDTLARDKARREELQRQEAAWRKADSSRVPPPVYLGDGVKIVDSSLSPNLRWLLVVTEPKNADAGQAGRMPAYVTESGYEEFQDVRTRVGRNDPVAQTLWLVDIGHSRAIELEYGALPGIASDPLAELRRSAGKESLKGQRALRVGDIQWSADGAAAAVMLRAVDNKDRWLATLAPAQADPTLAKLQPRHRLTDPGWINWNFNDFGWLDGDTLWFLSEESGFSHLYTQAGNSKPRALTRGNWEASESLLDPANGNFLFLCNRAWPGKYEVCSVAASGGEVRELTDLGGVEAFALSPDARQLLVTHSRSYLPAQLAVLPVAGGPATPLTDTRSAAFKAREWIEPEIVQIPSTHFKGSVWGKYYGPKQLEPGRKYPIVMFVHGAGYLQNVHLRYPAYFREQMFHNLLVQQGYLVLDLDFRGSEGYGRDWRTAVYRNMGQPELEDYLDGLAWLGAHKQGDADRAGIYGGSYGGFMTFMALFRSPGTFKAGAALRPVLDWSQYNHPYTSNILNTPDIDPEAYRKSSPIEYAAGLQDHLLIAHGMIDDNVFYRDSVVLAQKLIELRKDNWELASYPLERHGFTRSDSWYDEYRRIYELFERTLKP